MNALSIFLCINILLLCLLGVRLLFLHRQLAALKTRCDLLETLPALSDDLRAEAQRGTVLISLRILNPMQLAINKVWLAGIAGRITPSTIRRIVAIEAIKQINRELKNYGVVADVKVVDHD